MDTDAAGIWHYSTVIRWAEEAETELHRRLGTVDQIIGFTPRVRVEFEFRTPLRFDDVIDVSLSITGVGDSSITYQVEVHKDGELAASGNVVAVLIDRETGGKRSWPEETRRALGSS